MFECFHVEPNGFDQLEMSATGTGMQTSLKYARPEPRTQSKAVSATLNWFSEAQYMQADSEGRHEGQEWRGQTCRHQQPDGRRRYKHHLRVSVRRIWFVFIRRIFKCYSSPPGSGRIATMGAACRVYVARRLSPPPIYLEVAAAGRGWTTFRTCWSIDSSPSIVTPKSRTLSNGVMNNWFFNLHCC